MATKSELMTALRNAHAAGDTEAAKRIAGMIESTPDTVESAPALETAPTLMGQASELFTGAERTTPELEAMEEITLAPELNDFSVPAFKTVFGLMSTGDTQSLKGILSSQMGDKVSFNEDSKGNVVVNLPSGSYALNKPGLSGRDVSAGVMDMLAFTPAGRAASIPGAIAKSAGTEALLEAGEAGVGGEFDVKDVAFAGLTGGFFKGIENALGAGYRAFKGSGTDDVIEAGKDAGIPLLTSDIKQPETFVSKSAQQITEKIPLAGTGGMRETQQKAREQAVAEVAERYGQFSYESIVESLTTQKNRVKNAAGSVLNNTGNKLDDIGEIPLTNTQEAIDKASGELSKPGVIKSSQAMDDLDVLITSMKEAPQSFTTLKENRTAFREIIAGADKAERSQLTSRAKSLLQNVESGMKKDMDSFAKGNLTPAEYGKWQKANTVYAEEARNLTKTRLKNVLDKGDVTPESVGNLLFSQKPSEVRLLYRSLTPEGRANARSAIISKVVNDLGRRASGLTPNSFASEMKKYGLQVNEFFKGEEKKQLNGFLKVLEATRRAQDASITTPTGQQLIGAFTLASAATDLGLTVSIGGTVGGLARLYESAPVRNALLRLDSIPKGSTQYEKALAEAFQILSTSAQTLREQVSDTE